MKQPHLIICLLIFLNIWVSGATANTSTLGGYLTTNLDSANGGTISMLVYAPFPGPFTLYYEGLPIGVTLRDDGMGTDAVANDGVAVWELGISGNAPNGQFLLTVPEAQGWPYLVVEEGALPTATPTPLSSPSPTATPSPTPTFTVPSEAELLAAASSFQPMPITNAELRGFVGSNLTFSSGAPFNDLEFTVFDTDYIDGENSGFDVFMPVDPSELNPGSDQVKLIRAVLISDLDAEYGGARGDRVILGTHEHGPFFTRGPNGLDDDFAVISQFDYNHGYLQLAGNESDYRLVYGTAADGVATEGSYLFRIVGGTPDLIAFIFPCDVFAPTISGRPPQFLDALCNSSKVLDLSNSRQFRFAQPLSATVAQPSAAQVGSTGKEVISGITTDAQGNSYLFGLTDGAIGGMSQPNENAVFVTSIAPSGQSRWTASVELPNGSILKDAVTDQNFLYAVGRTQGALPGYQNGGNWDAIILKLSLTDGSIVATDQFASPGIDGYGNVTLDGKGGLFVSAQGAPPASQGPGGTDRDYLVAKHSTATLQNLWRVIERPDDAVLASAEAWGGLTYVPANGTAPERLIAGGWFFAATGADAFVAVYENLSAATPIRAHYQTIAAPGRSADWVLDSAVADDGSIFVAGFTTGNLGSQPLGEGDAFVQKLSPSLQTLATYQFGTPHGDLARKIEIDSSGNVIVVGYTYGDLFGPNQDPSNQSGDVFVLRLDQSLNVLNSRQLGTPHEDRSGLSLRNGDIHLGGMTEGNMGGASAGSFDGWAMVLDGTALQ